MWWTLLLQKNMPPPVTPPHYYLLAAPTARIRYGVDHSTYMSTLAKDMGSSPSLLRLWWEHGWFVVLIYWCVRASSLPMPPCSLVAPFLYLIPHHPTLSPSFSAAFTTNYRLTGPFASPSAPHIVKTEILETVLRRGILGNLIMGVIPMIFYFYINAFAYAAECVWVLGGRPRWVERRVVGGLGLRRVRSKGRSGWGAGGRRVGGMGVGSRKGEGVGGGMGGGRLKGMGM